MWEIAVYGSLEERNDINDIKEWMSNAEKKETKAERSGTGYR